MDKKELRKLSKNELIQIILDLMERLGEVENQLKAFDNPHTPSSRKQKKNTEMKGVINHVFLGNQKEAKEEG